MSEVVKNFSVCGVQEIASINKVAKQADGAVMLQVGNSVVLAAVVSDPVMIEEDFIPLTVQYIEKSYAVGKIPGGFVKRETKPSDFETLTSRIVDRSLRPLFPKGYNYPTQISVTVLSADQEVDLQVLALKAASMALYISDIPVEKMVTGVRVGKIDGKLVANPTMSQLENSTLDLYVAGSKEELLMIEMMAKGGVKEVITPLLSMDPLLQSDATVLYSANEMTEPELIEALRFAKDVIESSTKEYEAQLSTVAKPTRDAVLKKELIDENALTFVKKEFGADILAALDGLAKSERSMALKNVAKAVCAHDHVVAQQWDTTMMKQCVEMIKREMVRAQILDEKRRADGRKCNEVRPIAIETNILPMAHGSCLFTRGQTQALVVATLGTEMDKQSATLLTDSGNRSENFMFHYNFPGFSVGEASRIGAPGRRELGHGNLAKRALEGTVAGFDGAIRVVSEILESNGSSSMASVCGGSLALAASNVACTDLVAGVAMGLVTEGDRYEILTDIMGLEDHDGDMDFKVAGTRTGITALQMDIKLGGISYELLTQALDQAKEGRLHILGLMEDAAQKIVINEKVLPSTEFFTVATDKIVDIIGQAGKTIREIIEKFEVAIDLDRAAGGVKVVGRDKEKVIAAKEHILDIISRPKMGKPGAKAPIDTSLFKVDDIYTGPVKKVADFGAFVEIAPGVEGMVHISKMGKGRIANIHDVVKEGDTLEVKVLAISGSKLELGLTNPF